jgi:hypothetical protein
LADAQPLADWPQLLQELLRQTHPLCGKILFPLPALHHYWGVTQSEYATEVIFKRPEALQQHYPARRAQLPKLGCDAFPGSSSPDDYRQGKVPLSVADCPCSEPTESFAKPRALTVIRSPLMGTTWSLRSLLRNTPTSKIYRSGCFRIFANDIKVAR